MKRCFLNLFLSFIFIGVVSVMESCISSASVANFPKSASAYDFIKLSQSYVIKRQNGKWSHATLYEYFMNSTTTSDSLLMKNIEGALKTFGYTPTIINYPERMVLGKSGIKMNEWKTIVGVYYKVNDSSSDIYVRVQISQDITGGLKEERAQQLGELICRTLKTCRAAYDISTNKK